MEEEEEVECWGGGLFSSGVTGDKNKLRTPGLRKAGIVKRKGEGWKGGREG